MKLYMFSGHNPDSDSAKAREEKKAEMHVADVVCCKCGEGHKTLYKVDGNYICVDCKDKI